MKVVQTWHATTPNYRSGIIVFIKIYFINFGAVELKLWKTNFVNPFFKKNRRKTLDPPESTPAEALTGGTQGSWPHGSATPHSGRLRLAGSRRRWGLRPRGEHQRAPRSEAHPRVPLDRSEDDRSTPASMHGGTAALLAVARPLWCGRTRACTRPSFLTVLRT